MASRRTTARLRKQASLAADLATDPQASVLRQALSEALSNYKFGVHQARGISGVVRKSATQAVPQMDQYFKTASDSLQRNLASVGINPATVGGPAAADIADTQNRIALTQAASKGELTSRANDAAAGLQFQVGNLASQFANQTNKINTQLADLQATKGKTAESTLLQLLNQEAGRSLTRRGQNLSHADRQSAADALANYRTADINIRRGIDPVTGKKLKTGKSGGMTSAEIRKNTASAQRNVQQALTWLKRGAPTDQLISGATVPHQQTYTDPSTGKSKVHFVNIKVPQIDQLYVQAAHDLQRNGVLQPGTIHALRIAGVHAETIGPLSKPRRGAAPRNFGERPT